MWSVLLIRTPIPFFAWSVLLFFRRVPTDGRQEGRKAGGKEGSMKEAIRKEGGRRKKGRTSFSSYSIFPQNVSSYLILFIIFCGFHSFPILLHCSSIHSMTFMILLQNSSVVITFHTFQQLSSCSFFICHCQFSTAFFIVFIIFSMFQQFRLFMVFHIFLIHDYS